MIFIDKYIYKEGKKLRYGYTTGSCAAAAAKAATYMLLTRKPIKTISLLTPKGIMLNLDVKEISIGDSVVCAIEKDSGDDPDVTNKILVYAKLEKTDFKGIFIDGGVGVGRITKKGLQQNIGEAAINKVPKLMIENEVKSIIDETDYKGGVKVEIFIPKGIEIAKKTFNERLGIKGGISILGTTGIVEPMSEAALVDSIKLEMKILKENGHDYILVTPGNYGETFSKDVLKLNTDAFVKCSNYIGETLDYAREIGIKGIVLIGHIGKFVKLAGGIMNTHSKYGDCRLEILAAHAALNGGEKSLIESIMTSTTTDEALEHMDKYNLTESVLDNIQRKIDFHLKSRVYNEVKVETVVFSNNKGILCKTKGVDELLAYFKEDI